MNTVNLVGIVVKKSEKGFVVRIKEGNVNIICYNNNLQQPSVNDIISVTGSLDMLTQREETTAGASICYPLMIVRVKHCEKIGVNTTPLNKSQYQSNLEHNTNNNHPSYLKNQTGSVNYDLKNAGSGKEVAPLP